MGSPSGAAAPGAIGALLPVRSLSGQCNLDLDPCGGWVVDLLKDAYAGNPPSWPTHSKGLQMLLAASRLRHGRDGTPSDSTAPALDIQETLNRTLASQGDAPRTAIRVHQDLAGLISAAQEAICTFGWFHDPASALFVCADQAEAAEIEPLLRSDYDQERGEDLLETAKALAEGLMAPSPEWRYSGPGPVVLASKIPPGASWREVFLSPGCRGLTADQLLPAVVAAKNGVHVVAATAGP